MTSTEVMGDSSPTRKDVDECMARDDDMEDSSEEADSDAESGKDGRCLFVPYKSKLFKVPQNAVVRLGNPIKFDHSTKMSAHVDSKSVKVWTSCTNWTDITLVRSHDGITYMYYSCYVQADESSDCSNGGQDDTDADECAEDDQRRLRPVPAPIATTISKLFAKAPDAPPKLRKFFDSWTKPAMPQINPSEAGWEVHPRMDTIRSAYVAPPKKPKAKPAHPIANDQRSLDVFCPRQSADDLVRDSVTSPSTIEEACQSRVGGTVRAEERPMGESRTARDRDDEKADDEYTLREMGVKRIRRIPVPSKEAVMTTFVEGENGLELVVVVLEESE